VATIGNAEGSARPEAGWAFWAVLAALAIYVGLCIRQRENNGETDDWEHHRAIVALSKDLWKPGNPTYATDEPSIRYSPYSLGLALIVRSGAVDAYDALSGAGVASTVLMGLGLRSFLARYGHRRLASTALVVMVVLWGGVPGYANSYALADLPIQQVNPSAFAWALALFMWSWFRHLADSGARAPGLAGIALLGALAMLSHAMTGAAAVIGLGIVALAAPPARRVALLAGAGIVGLGILAACSAWPWYDFVLAVRGSKEDADYWYNKWILILMLTTWSAPAIALSACAWPLRGRELVRVGYLGAAVFYALSASSLVTKSALTARFPMVGIFFLHLLVAAYLGEVGLFRPGSWPGRIRDLSRSDYGHAARPILDVIAGLLLASCLVPQVWTILKEPALARAYVAPLLRLKDEQNYVKRRYDRLLKGVGDRDVVLSDASTSWAVPSTAGRIVVANHLEFFTPGQKQRAKDVETFLSPASTEEGRRAILERYDVRWILLSRKAATPEVFAALLRPSAVVASDGDLRLMDARLWEQAR